MGKGRPGGNPDLAKYAYVAAGDEPLIKHLQIKVTPSQEAIKDIPNWQQKLRDAIDRIVSESVAA
jgi:hypothetical protein